MSKPQVGREWPLLFGHKMCDESSNVHGKFTRKEICFTNCYIMQNNYPSQN